MKSINYSIFIVNILINHSIFIINILINQSIFIIKIFTIKTIINCNCSIVIIIIINFIIITIITNIFITRICGLLGRFAPIFYLNCSFRSHFKTKKKKFVDLKKSPIFKNLIFFTKLKTFKTHLF